MRLSSYYRDIGRVVAFHPQLNDITGGTLATILLGQFFFWTPEDEECNGWFAKTAEEIAKATGLSSTEQRTARDALRKRGLLEEEFKGRPPRWHFRINLTVLDDLWERRHELAAEDREKNRSRTEKATQARLEKHRAKQAKTSPDEADSTTSDNPQTDDQTLRETKGSTLRETNGSTLRETNGSTLRETNGQPHVPRSDETHVKRDLLLINKKNINTRVKEREEEPLSESTLSVVLAAYANVVISGADEAIIGQQVATIEGKGGRLDDVKQFLASTSLRHHRFFAQNFLVWRESEMRRREKQLRESLVGASPEYKHQRLSGYAESLPAEQPQPHKRIPRDVSMSGEANHPLWEEICGQIEQSLNRICFATWFQPTRGVALDGTVLIVQVPDTVFEDYILNNYRDLLEQALPESVTGIQFVTSVELDHAA